MKIQLIENWQQFYRLYSIWFFAFIAILPDVFNLAVSYGLLESENAPESLSYSLKVVAFLGALARLIKQQKLILESQEPPIP